jgi:hypothetical protein
MSYMRKDFLIYEEMRKYLATYEEACHYSILNFLIYGENFLFFFISVYATIHHQSNYKSRSGSLFYQMFSLSVDNA